MFNYIQKYFTIICFSFSIIGCATVKNTWDNLPFRRAQNLKAAFNSLEVGMKRDQAIKHINSFFPGDGKPTFESLETDLADEVLVYGSGMYSLYFKQGKIWFTTERGDNKESVMVVASSNSDFKSLKIFLKPVKRDEIEMTSNDPVFKKLRPLFSKSLTEAGYIVVGEEKYADTILLLSWEVSNEKVEYDIEVPIYTTSYIPGSQTSTNYYTPSGGYVGQSTSYTAGRAVTSYAGSKTVKQANYFDFYKITIIGVRNIKSQQNEHFTVRMGFTDSHKNVEYDDVVSRLFAFSLPFWGDNIKPAKSLHIPTAYPPNAILE